MISVLYNSNKKLIVDYLTMDKIVAVDFLDRNRLVLVPGVLIGQSGLLLVVCNQFQRFLTYFWDGYESINGTFLLKKGFNVISIKHISCVVNHLKKNNYLPITICQEIEDGNFQNNEKSGDRKTLLGTCI